jgi:hypothetical protein
MMGRGMFSRRVQVCSREGVVFVCYALMR